MFDRRYPFLMRLEDSEIPDSMRPHYRKVVDEVRRRTGLSACYRKPCGSIAFYLGDPSRMVWSQPVRFKDTPEPWRRVQIEPLVQMLIQWKASKTTKQRWVEEQERLDREFQEKSEDRFLDERRSETRDHFKKLRTNRRTIVKSGRLGQKAMA